MKIIALLGNYLCLSLLWLMAKLPYSWVIQCGYALGWLAEKLPTERKQVIKINLALCFPELSEKERNHLAKKNWRLLGRSILERGKIWLGGEQTIRNIVTVTTKIDVCDKKPRLYISMHLMGLEAGLIASSLYLRDINGPKNSCTYSRIKNLFFEQHIKQWRERFGAEMFLRQQATRKIIRAVRRGDFVTIAPDMDLGRLDSVFAPFFGISSCTISAISRIAKATAAEVCPLITTLRADGKGYECHIGQPWPNFPSDDLIKDAAYMNHFFEQHIRPRIAEYWWIHKRFKNRPVGEKRFY